MPLFPKKKSLIKTTEAEKTESAVKTYAQPLVFHCQLAHGSPTGLITGFNSVRELYKKVSECYEIPESDILYCTINTHKVDMSKLLGGQIGLDDFIFVHCKGRPKEIELVKTTDALGLTITDNGNGIAYIKRIVEGSIMDVAGHIFVGDHIEKLNGESLVGKRHLEVARALKDIPTHSTFTLRLVEPLKTSFQDLGPRTPKGSGHGTGKETVRFKANGQYEIVSQIDEATQMGVEAINNLLDTFMGINDGELAHQIYDLGADKGNSMEFAEAVDNSDLEIFGFTDDLIIEMWGAITDAKRQKAEKAGK